MNAGSDEKLKRRKNICYLISGFAPSTIVRGKTFEGLYNKYGINVNYYFFHSKIIEMLSTRLIGFGFFKLAKIVSLGNSFIGRIKKEFFLRIVKRYDGIIVIKFISSTYLSLLKNKYSGLILYDHDDTMWLNSFLGRNEYEKILKLADYVSCDNRFLQKRAQELNINSFVVAGPTQIEKFNCFVPDKTDSSQVIIGWLGSDWTVFYLFAIYNQLEYIGKKYPDTVLRIVGSTSENQMMPKFEMIKVEYIPSYDEKMMIEETSKFDIGVFPLFENEMSAGRGMLKARIYMSAGVPVICSNVGEVGDLIIHGKNGYISKNDQEWLENIEFLILNRKERNKVGACGKETIQKRYSKEKCFESLEKNFLSLL